MYALMCLEWHFNLHTSLRLNLTFLEVKLRAVFGFWQSTMFCIFGRETKDKYSRSTKERFTFGGLKSEFSVYLLGRFVSVELNQHVDFLHGTMFKYSSHVISRGLVANIKPHQKHQKFLLISSHKIIITELKVFALSIVVQKHQIINLQFNAFNQSKVCFLLFQGPGFNSPKSSVKKLEKRIVTNSFICLLQAVLHTGSHVHGIQFKDVEYYGKDLLRTVVHANQNTSLKELFFLSGKHKKYNSSACSVYLVQSPHETVVNITIQEFKFIGEPENSCKFGGISFYDSSSNTTTEEYLFCNKHLTTSSLQWSVSRSLFSYTSTYLLVIYAHNEYCSLHTRLQVSHSPCKTIKLQNVCEKMIAYKGRVNKYGGYLNLLNTLLNEDVLSLNSSSCIMIEFSSGLYKVLPEKGEKSMSYLMIREGSYPTKCCYSVHVKTSGITISHTANIFGDYFPGDNVYFHFDVIDSEKVLGNYTITGLEQSVPHTKQISTLTRMYADIWEQWEKSDENFVAQINFFLKGSFRFISRFHHWAGSWMNYLVQTSDVVLKSTPALELIRTGPIVFSYLPIPSKQDSFLVLTNRPITKTSLWFTFVLVGVQFFEGDINVAQREWRSAPINASGHSKYILAAAGRFRKITMEFTGFFSSKHFLLSSNSTSFYVNWVRGSPTALKMKTSLWEWFIYENDKIGRTIRWKSIILGSYMFTERDVYRRRESDKVSWNEGLELCHSRFGGNLPEFISRNSQDFLLNVLKNSEDIPLIPVIFMALNFSTGTKR